MKPVSFEQVVGFHGHRCLDIAVGYRVAQAAAAAMEQAGIDPSRMVATVGNDTCAVDAIQAVTGCTFGKRNLVPQLTGKPAYTVQDGQTGHGVRIYVHYWESFDTNGTFRGRMSQWKSGALSAAEAKAFEAEHEQAIEALLSMPEGELFRITRITTAPPPKSGGFAAAPCEKCGEYVKEEMLSGGVCAECG